LISTASRHSTPDRYAGGAGARVPSPWSVKITKFKPARAAAAATSSGVPDPSDVFVCTWSAPTAVRAADGHAGGGSVSRFGGRRNRTKTKAAAKTAAAARSNRFTTLLTIDYGLSTTDY